MEGWRFLDGTDDVDRRETITAALDELLAECRGNRRRLAELIEHSQRAVDQARSVVLRCRRERALRAATGD